MNTTTRASQETSAATESFSCVLRSGVWRCLISISLLLILLAFEGGDVPTAAAQGLQEDQGPQGETVTPGGHLPKGQTSITVVTRPDGVYVQIIYRDSSPGQANGSASTGPGTSTQGARPRTSTTNSASSVPRSWSDPRTGVYYTQTADGTIYSLEPMNIGRASAAPGGWFDTGSRQHPNSIPYVLSRNGVYQGIVWIPINTPSVNVSVSTTTGVTGSQSVQVDPRNLALDILKHVPLPNARLRANPGLGLVALPAWFWVEGYDGKPFGASQVVDIPPEVGSDTPESAVTLDDPRRQSTSVVVEVRVQPSRYEWSFGDGKALVTQSLGQPYPKESDVKHTYQYSSLRFPSGFPLRLTFEFSAEYQVNGGPPQVLPPITRVYEATYQVQEIQPVLTRP